MRTSAAEKWAAKKKVSAKLGKKCTSISFALARRNELSSGPGRTRVDRSGHKNWGGSVPFFPRRTSFSFFFVPQARGGGRANANQATAVPVLVRIASRARIERRRGEDVLFASAGTHSPKRPATIQREDVLPCRILGHSNLTRDDELPA